MAAGDTHGVGCSEHSNGCEGVGGLPAGPPGQKVRRVPATRYESGFPYRFQARREGVQMSGSQHEVCGGEP